MDHGEHPYHKKDAIIDVNETFTRIASIWIDCSVLYTRLHTEEIATL